VAAALPAFLDTGDGAFVIELELDGRLAVGREEEPVAGGIIDLRLAAAVLPEPGVVLPVENPAGFSSFPSFPIVTP